MANSYISTLITMFGLDPIRFKDTLDGMDKDAIVIEYLLIQKKASYLSRNKRDAIVRVVNKWEELGELEFEGCNWRFVS